VLIRTLDNSCTNGKQTISDVDRWHAVNSNPHTSWISMEENGVCVLICMNERGLKIKKVTDEFQTPLKNLWVMPL
jgi:hypothetical protein